MGSCNRVRELASTLLSVDINQLSFPNEEDAATLLSESGISSGHLLFSASQKDLQATLDKYLFDDLFASFGICNQARLTAFVTPFCAQVAAGSKLFLESVWVLLSLAMGLNLLLDNVYGWVFLCFRSLLCVPVFLPQITIMVTIC